MTRWTLAASMALAALGAVAVLDVGSSPAEAAPSASPFEGSWSGTYVFGPDAEFEGTLEWSISDQGVITGTFHNITPFGDDGTWAGRVDPDGTLVLIARKPRKQLGCWPYQGTLVIGDDGILVASYTASFNDPSGAFSEVATLTRN